MATMFVNSKGEAVALRRFGGDEVGVVVELQQGAAGTATDELLRSADGTEVQSLDDLARQVGLGAVPAHELRRRSDVARLRRRLERIQRRVGELTAEAERESAGVHRFRHCVAVATTLKEDERVVVRQLRELGEEV